MPAKDGTKDLVAWMNYLVKNKKALDMHYAQVRPFPLSIDKKPIKTDCSGGVTLLCKLAGLPDPNKLGYSGYGFTGTLMTANRRVFLKQNYQVGDLVIYGEYPGVHVAMIVETSKDPLTWSMGQEGDPSWVRISQDGRPYKVYRIDKRQQHAPTPIPGA